MEILTEITKAVFETHIPAAKMPEHNSSVYNRIKEQFEVTYSQLVTNVISSNCVAELDTNTELKKTVVRYVCLKGFAQTVHSLDLVLTATGFGIVSTESMAPASKIRVDALLEDVMLEAKKAEHSIIRLMTSVAGWCNTFQAHKLIDVLFWDINYLAQYTTKKETTDNWQQARGLAVTADGFLRKVVSDEYMDKLLDRMRQSSLTDEDMVIVGKCNQFTGGFISNYELDRRPNKMQLDAIMLHLEANIINYPEYEASEVYKARHAERYENRKEDPSFFFM